MAIALADTPITAMNEQFGTLVPSNITSTVNCFLLCIDNHSGTRRAGPLNRPSIIMRNYVLISLRHFNLQNM